MLCGEVVGAASGGVEGQDEQVVGGGVRQGGFGFGGGGFWGSGVCYAVGGVGLLCGPVFGAVEVGGLLFGGVFVVEEQVAEVEGECVAAFWC